jgi:hypothetical protein
MGDRYGTIVKTRRDYYGNYIPSRDQVQAGTKGSYLFVSRRMGSDWATKMNEVV